MNRDLDRDVVLGTIRDIRESISVLEAQLAEKRSRLRYWEAKLSENAGVSAQVSLFAGGQGRPRGSNAEAISATLSNAGERGMTLTEIAQATRLPTSSVRTVLLRDPQRFEQRGKIWVQLPEKKEEG